MIFREPTTRIANPVELDADEIDFLESIKPWTQEMWSKKFGTKEQRARRKNIKDKFRTELQILQNNFCAFCGLNLSEVPEVHREHIAPQYQHTHYIFEPRNIVLACFFCNKRKGKKTTVITDTNNYATTTFKILHPFRDDFIFYLECSFENRELIFSIREGLTDPHYNLADQTIKCVGLNDTDLVKQRGMIIFCNSIPSTPEEDEIIREIISVKRKASR